MSLEEVKAEITYYTGKKRVSDAEAKEILWFVEQNRNADLSQIISDYYGC